ncbi:MAG: cytochrome c nitrite reductase small subunit [Anaerolineae bacterium]|nr:cytochrome c nitrite reductase small subunit [Anaerolineae bacterium]
MRFPLLISVICLATVFGIGVYVTNFPEYMGSDPSTCNNCHVMDAAYEGWYYGSHRQGTTCIDCHAPHEVIPKYYIKAKSGMRDVLHFSLGWIPEPLRATHETDEIIQQNCIRCHTAAVAQIGDTKTGGGRYCFDCHRTVAHGPRGLSLAPYQDTGLYPTPLLEEK